MKNNKDGNADMSFMPIAHAVRTKEIFSKKIEEIFSKKKSESK